MNVRKLLGITLCSVVFSFSPLQPQDGSFVGADGKPMVERRSTDRPEDHRLCGKTYYAQYNAHYDTLNSGRKLTKQEKKDIESRIIPYAHAESRLVELRDLDNDGVSDYIGLRGESMVRGCSITDKYLLKNNELIVELSTGHTMTQRWVGDLPTSLTIYPGSPLIKVSMRDIDNNVTTRMFNYKVQ